MSNSFSTKMRLNIDMEADSPARFRATKILFMLMIYSATIRLVKSADPAPYKLLVVLDRASEEQEKIASYINASVAVVSKQLEFAVIEPPQNSVDKSYQDVCASIDGGANFIISLAKEKAVVAAVSRATRISNIPTIQLDYRPWLTKRLRNSPRVRRASAETSASQETPDGVETNRVLIVPPEISMLNVIFDIAPAVNMSRLAVVYDELYDTIDINFKQMISKLPFNVTVKKGKQNETDITDQISDLRKLGYRYVLLLSSTLYSEKFAMAAKQEMENSGPNRMLFIMMTKDVRPFQCENCIRTDALWLRPDQGEEKYFSRIKEFKDYLHQPEVLLDELISQETEIDVAFYHDLTYFAWQVISYMNSSYDLYPVFGCYNTSLVTNRTATLSEMFKSKNVFGKNGPQGSYGPYVMSANGKLYQDIEMKIVRVYFDDRETRIMKPVGNWTTILGLAPTHEGNILVDVNKIKHYRVAIVVQPPFIEAITNEDGSVSYRGYCIDLIRKIKDLVNFTYEEYEVKDKTYGTINDQGEWNGLIRELITGNAEIALAPLSVMAERENVVDFTVPYYDLVGTTILMKKQEVDYSLFKFMTVLEPPVWGCIVGAYFFTSFLLWIFDRFSPYSFTNNKDKYVDDPEKREFTLKECLWFCMTSLTPQGGGEAPKNISGRLVAATWWLFGFIIIASYTANLAAFLTVSRLETPISSLDDLAKQYKIKYAPVKGTASEVYFRRMAEIEDKFYDIWKQMSLNESMSAQERAKLAVWDYPVSDKFTNMWRYMQEAGLPNTTEEAIERVKQSVSATEGFAFIGDATEIGYAELIDCSLQKVGNEFSRKPYAIAVQQGNHLKDQISSAILKLLNQRELEQLKEKWWTQNPNRKSCPKSEDESDGISIQNIGGVFIVILAGIALSLITLGFEYWYYKDKIPAEDDNNNDNVKPKPVKAGVGANRANAPEGRGQARPRNQGSYNEGNNIKE